MDGRTKLIHYTSGGPWFEECKDHPYAQIWFEWRDRYRGSDQVDAPRGEICLMSQVRDRTGALPPRDGREGGSKNEV
jgi:hypothetical protein